MIKGIKVAFADIHYRVGGEYYFGGKRVVIGGISEEKSSHIKYEEHGFYILDVKGDVIVFIFKAGNGIILEYE